MALREGWRILWRQYTSLSAKKHDEEEGVLYIKNLVTEIMNEP